MSKLSKSRYLILTCILSVGFADCNFSASESTVTLQGACPANFTLPSHLESADSTVFADADSEYKAGTCSKLRHYRVTITKNVKGLHSGDSKKTFDSYLGISDKFPCKLIMGIALVGPNDADDEVFSQTTSALNSALLETVKSSEIKYDPESFETTIIGDRQKTQDWCNKLTVLPLKMLSN